MNLISPKDIYKEVRKKTDAVLNTLGMSSENIELSKAIDEARNIFLKFKNEADAVLDELEKNAEWDALTVALYGETNAGKSTIIETLRILMGEKSKQEQQLRFRQIREKFNIDQDIVETWKLKKQEILQHEEDLKNLTSKFARLHEKQKIIHSEIHSHIEQLILQINSLPFWRRSLSFLWKIPQISELNYGKEQLNFLAIETQQLTQEHEDEKSKIMAKVESAKNKVAEIDFALKELEAHQDGAIIGDGQSDFTRESTSYEFTANGNKFVLLDVPGIEGKEELVREPIMQAVRKAHAVFYVTRKADPPQKGDDKTSKGTLEKIKEHLGAQTEVWTIFNKSIKSAEQLRAPQLINTGEIESLKVMEEEMRKQLGGHYAGTIKVSAFPAFVASTDHFTPGNAKSKDRSKFLAVMKASDILEKTGIQFLAGKISSDMVVSTKEKIRKSNFNKANDTVIQLKSNVLELNKIKFKPLFQKLEDQARDSISQLESATDSLKHNIESAVMSLIRKNRDALRKKIYKKIDDDISNDEFKTYLDEHIALAIHEVENQLPTEIKKQSSLFQQEAENIAEQFHEHVQEFLEDASSTDEMNFRLNIKIDNGVNTIGLVSSVISAALLFFVPGPGWIALIVGAIGILISAYKAVRSFFNSDYKKSQQRHSADENIDKIFRTIKTSYTSQLDEDMQKLTDSLSEIKKRFQLPTQQAELITSSLKDSARQLELLSLKIIKEGCLQ